MRACRPWRHEVRWGHWQCRQNDVGAARRDGARRAVIVLLAIVVGALCGLMVVGLHRAGVSLPFWDARSTSQKYADAWRSEASRLTWPGSPPAFSPPPSNVDSSVVGTAVTYLDASWLCDWGRVSVANHSSRPARAALAVKTDGATVIVATHDAQVAGALSTCIHLERGSVREAL